MCLARGPRRSDAGEARTHGPSVSSLEHSTTEPLHSLNDHSTFVTTVRQLHVIIEYVCFSLKTENRQNEVT